MAKHLFVRQQCEDGADDGAVDKGEGGEVVDDEVSDWQLRTGARASLLITLFICCQASAGASYCIRIDCTGTHGA